MKKVVLFAVIALFCQSCIKSGNVIPNVQVAFEDALTDPRLQPLNVPGGAVLIDGYGVAGLILYRGGDGSYLCYDRCSTVNPQKVCPVNLNTGDFTVTDPCSGGEWALSDGEPVKAPATLSLKSYNVEVSNFEIFVSN
jgi:nitrite reductase/ring-hydroxylating ferredoxin subunit